MKKIITVAAIAGSLSMNAQMHSKQEQKYPETRKADNVDTYFGTNVPDPYRWLEDDRSEETAKWVQSQNEVTFDYLSKIPFRDAIKSRLEELWNYERIGAPFNEGSYTYYYKNNGLQNQSVLYRKDKNGNEEVFLDPNTFSKDGTTSLGGINFTKDGSMAAYSISEGGSDWRKIFVLDTRTKKIIGETIADVKFSGISWKGNEGFYYSSYEKPKGSELSAKTDEHKLYFHKLGTPQSQDKVIFGHDKKRRYVGGYVTEDQKYLVISAANSTSGNELYIKDLTKPDSKIIALTDDFDSDSSIIDNNGSTLYIATNYKALNMRIVTVDASNPKQANWKDLIPETKNVLSPSTGGGYIFAEYMQDAVSVVKQYDYNGKLVRNIELPGVGTAGGFSGKKDETVLYYSFTNYITPGSIYSYDPKT